jgi:hypothetical protein
VMALMRSPASVRTIIPWARATGVYGSLT